MDVPGGGGGPVGCARSVALFVSGFVQLGCGLCGLIMCVLLRRGRPMVELCAAGSVMVSTGRRRLYALVVK